MFSVEPAPMFLASRFVWGLLFAMMSTVSMIYQVEVAHLSPLELVLVGTALEGSAFLFEVPTGVIADRYSRKRSVVIGFAVIGSSFVLAGSFAIFEVLALASFVLGFGWTCLSGAHEAWLADEVGVERASRLYLHGQRRASYGSFLGIGAAMAIGSIDVRYPLLLSGLGFMLWAIAAGIGMRETGRAPSQHARESALAGMRRTFGVGARRVRGSRTLMLLMAVGVVVGTFSEGYDRLATAHLLRSFDFPRPFDTEPVVVFGAMAALASALSAFVLRIAEARIDPTRTRDLGRTLSFLCLAIAGLALCFAATDAVWVAIGIHVALHPLRSVADPLTTAWVNQHATPEARATVLSMHGQADALGQLAGGPIVGLVAETLTLRLALATTGLLLAPAVWLYCRAQANQLHDDAHAPGHTVPQERK